MKYLTLAFLFLASAAFAADEYATVNEGYSRATKPTPRRMLGWYTGRCFSVSKPTIAIPALLTTYRSGKILKAVFWREFDKPETYYDRLTPELIKEISDGLRDYDADIPVLTPKDTYWEAVHLGEHRDETRTRAGRSRIYVQAFHDSEQTNACFFFRRVR